LTKHSLQEAGIRPIALMLHKPLFQNTCQDDAPHIRYVPLEPRRRLSNLITRLDVRILLSGHVHRYLDRIIGGIRHVWVPSTAFFLPDSIQEFGMSRWSHTQQSGRAAFLQHP
jgi:hypothetical protein